MSRLEIYDGKLLLKSLCKDFEYNYEKSVRTLVLNVVFYASDTCVCTGRVTCGGQ